MKEARRKLHVIGGNGIRDTMAGRLRSCEDSRADKLNTSSRSVRKVAGMDKLFNHEETRRAFMKCRKYQSRVIETEA